MSRVLGKTVLATLGSLLLLELGLRGTDAWFERKSPALQALLASKRTSLYRQHPYVGYMLKPNLGRGPTNSLGLRGPEVTVPKPPETFRILCLGASTTYGSEVSAEEAYPAQLQLELASHTTPDGRRFEVVNCGVPGFTTVESLVNLELRLVELEPDAVVIYHAANDARLIQSRGFEPDYSHIRCAFKGGALQVSALESWLIQHLHTYAWSSSLLGFGGVSQRLEDLVYFDNYPERMFPFVEELNLAGVEAYARNLRSLVSVARAHGISPALSTFATCRPRIEARDLSIQRCIEALNARLAELADELEVPLFQVQSALGDREELFGDYVHRTAAGCRVHAAKIVEQALTEGIWGL